MNEQLNEQDEVEYFRWWKILVVFVAVLIFGLIIGVIPVVAFHLRPDWAKAFPEKAGNWGDSFGFVNALLSALAFAGVLVTLWMQRRELQLQRDEMRLTREEMEATRTEHSRMAKSQEESENRLFLAAYMNALESLRQLSQWRMSADPALLKSATFPVVEGLVIQARVSQSLQILVRDLEPEIRRLHPSLTIVREEGSRVWRLEELLSIHISLRTMLESHRGRSDDSSSFEEAVNIACAQFDKLKKLKPVCGPSRHAAIDALLAKAPDLKWMTGDILATTVEAKRQREKYFNELEFSAHALLNIVMSVCHE